MATSVRIRLLGRFGVHVDGVDVPDTAWTRRQAAALVKLLALADQRRLHREQVVEALWPGMPPESAGARLHKAAHYARRALGDPSSVVLRQELVELFPGADVEVDVQDFLRLGREVLAGAGRLSADALLGSHPGALLPEDPYEPWVSEPREAVRALRLALLRAAGRWDEVLAEEPADEEAHLALARAAAGRGDPLGGLRHLERLEQAVRRELGTGPGPAAARLRAELQQAALHHRAVEPPVAGPPTATGRTRLVGRRDLGDRVRERIARAATGRGGALLVTGAPGVGKSALLDLACSLAEGRGWRTARGSASAMEGPWPYASVLEAFAGLFRQHPVLLDGLDDAHRQEVERALSGRDLSWSGESGHQRLFMAVAELMRLAAAGHGLLLAVDDVHDADEASLRLLHYLARCAATEQVLVMIAHRPALPPTAARMVESLRARDREAWLDVPPLTETATRRLAAAAQPSLTSDDLDHVWQVSAGVPFTALEVARRRAVDATTAAPALPGDVLATVRRVALLGTAFTTDEVVALCDGPDTVAYRHLELAVAALVVEPDTVGFRFRHTLVRDAVVAAMTPLERLAAHREVAVRLEELGAPPSRVAHHYLAAGLTARAVPAVVQAVETAGALGAYRDALALLDAVLPSARGEDRSHLLSRRGDLLLALGDPDAVAAYTEAVPHTTGTEHRIVRARLARAACFAGELDVARAAIAGLTLEGDEADAPLLLARGNLAYFVGDIDAAWAAASQARELVQDGADSWHLVDLVSLQGLIAHQRGEWFERFRTEIRRTRGKERLAVAVFDAHLCVAEYLLYGPVPYAEVMAEAEKLRTSARRAGALRGVAFATALVGEAALLAGDLDRAEAELTESIQLHREVDAPAGQAHSLQRLAELRLRQGRRAEARVLLERALPLARWSVISMHLLQRIFGTLVQAADDPSAACSAVERAEGMLAETDHCFFCDVMLEVPATIACADGGDLDRAREHLRAARESAARWEGGAWAGAVEEAAAHVRAAEGDPVAAARHWDRAAVLFEAAGHQRDAERCRTASLLPTR